MIAFFPENFINKEVNEPFIRKLMDTLLCGKEWVKGNPAFFEPDYFCDGVPFEFTLESNAQDKYPFVLEFLKGEYSSDDLEADVIAHLFDRISIKSHKHYSVNGVNLCVLCLVALTRWVSDYYGSVLHQIHDATRAKAFEEIKQKFIGENGFKNIFIIFPDSCACWWIFDVNEDKRDYYQLTDDEISSQKYPYFMDNQVL